MQKNKLSLLINLIILTTFFSACKKESLQIVSYEDFAKFINETDYITDAEKFGWSIVQKDVVNFEIVDSVNWRNAYDNIDIHKNLPVIQVSYNDAKAYADWSNTKIPTYEAYWELTAAAEGQINSGSLQILPIDQCHIIGNTWEITQPDGYGRIRIAGGSYLCNKNTCNGTSPKRKLHIDSITGNSHIGFAIIK